LSDPLRSRLAGESLCITFVTLGELTKWTVLRSWGPQRLAELASWRRRVVLLRFDDAVATTWGGDSGPRATPRATSAVNDAWIAACCLVDGLPLATFNTKDFADFAQYDGLRLIDAERRG